MDIIRTARHSPNLIAYTKPNFKMWPWSNKSSDAPTTPAKASPPAETKLAPSTTVEVKKSNEKFDPNKLPEREKLPPKLQNIIDRNDKEDNFFDELVEG